MFEASSPVPSLLERPREPIIASSEYTQLQLAKEKIWRMMLTSPAQNSIKKPKTSRYPSLKGTDPKFRRNHRYVLHGTMKALVSNSQLSSPQLRLESTLWGCR